MHYFVISTNNIPVLHFVLSHVIRSKTTNKFVTLLRKQLLDVIRLLTPGNLFSVTFSVNYDERYSDLEKSIYLPSPNIGGFSKETLKYEDCCNAKTGEFVRLHPCAQLGKKQVKNQIQYHYNRLFSSFFLPPSKWGVVDKWNRFSWNENANKAYFYSKGFTPLYYFKRQKETPKWPLC